jgi:hypothetical protein
MIGIYLSREAIKLIVYLLKHRIRLISKKQVQSNGSDGHGEREGTQPFG